MCPCLDKREKERPCFNSLMVFTPCLGLGLGLGLKTFSYTPWTPRYVGQEIWHFFGGVGGGLGWVVFLIGIEGERARDQPPFSSDKSCIYTFFFLMTVFSWFSIKCLFYIKGGLLRQLPRETVPQYAQGRGNREI